MNPFPQNPIHANTVGGFHAQPCWSTVTVNMKIKNIKIHTHMGHGSVCVCVCVCVCVEGVPRLLLRSGTNMK